MREALMHLHPLSHLERRRWLAALEMELFTCQAVHAHPLKRGVGEGRI
jgi:hypothetical protein